MDLPPLSLPQGSGQLIIETDASSLTWVGVLLEVIEGKEHVCGYGSGSFKAIELNYPSSRKEILAVKKTIQHFILFLKLVRFVIRTDLKIIPGIFKNENLMAENSSRILKWFIWLSNFDFDIVYKPGYLNCLADMLTKEHPKETAPTLSMFTAGASSSGADHGKAPLYQPRNGLLLKPWDESLSEADRRQLLDYATRKAAERYFDLTLIKQIEASPLKIQIMERWERNVF